MPKIEYAVDIWGRGGVEGALSAAATPAPAAGEWHAFRQRQHLPPKRSGWEKTARRAVGNHLRAI